MYRIAICEDDIDFIEYIKKVIIATNVVDANSLFFSDFYSGEQICFCSVFDYDLVIMDLQMKTMDGYEAAMKLRQRDRDFLLVFCSGVRKPEPLSFKANPFRYFLKESTEEEMICEMTEVISEMKDKKNSPYIVCRTEAREMVKVYPDSVAYISKLPGCCEVHLIDRMPELYPEGRLKINKGLDELHKIFNVGCGFVRAHNSYIVNMAHITSIDSNFFNLSNGENLTYSRARAKEFKQAFTRFVSSKY